MIQAAALYALAAAVVMHVAWNLAARHADPRSFFLWWALLGYLVLVGPWSMFALLRDADWSAGIAPLLLLTAGANALYFVALAAAYRRAPVPLVYPIARSSPVLIAVWMALIYNEELPLLGWAGILISVVGVLALSLAARGGEPARAIPWALVAALGTSGYSISNKLAVPALPGYATLLGWVSVAFAASWIALALQHRWLTGAWLPPVRPPLARLLIAGLFVGNGYALVIYAMRYIPAAYAVAFTNAGIVLAGVIAMLYFHEREQWRTRLAAMLVICAGLLLLALR